GRATGGAAAAGLHGVHGVGAERADGGGFAGGPAADGHGDGWEAQGGAGGEEQLRDRAAAVAVPAAEGRGDPLVRGERAGDRGLPGGGEGGAERADRGGAAGGGGVAAAAVEGGVGAGAAD